MRIAIILLLLLSAYETTRAQLNANLNVADPMTMPVFDSIILNQANQMAKALVSRDYKTYVRFFHPAALKAGGGEDSIIKTLKEGAEDMAKDGYAITSITEGVPSKVIDTANELQCTIPQSAELKIPEGHMIAKSTLIAVSFDRGKTWLFIDTDQVKKNLRKLAPTLSSRLKISPPQLPQIFKD